MKLKQLGIALDQLVNVLCAGNADETLSARAYRNEKKNKRWKFFYWLFNKMFFWQENHCRGAYFQELTRQHFPKDYRDKGNTNAFHEERKTRL